MDGAPLVPSERDTTATFINTVRKHAHEVLQRPTAIPRRFDADTDFEAVDKQALAVDVAIGTTVQDLWKALCCTAEFPHSPINRARLAFRWITAHITFVHSPGTKHNVETVLANRAADSRGFSQLFTALCTEAKVPAKTIRGRVRRHELDPLAADPKPTFTHLPHFWNTVTLVGYEHLVDITWCSGFMSAASGTPRFQPHFDPFYWLAPPDVFSWDHLPDGVAESGFVNQVVKYPSLRRHNLQLLQPHGRWCDWPSNVGTVSLYDGGLPAHFRPSCVFAARLVEVGFPFAVEFAATVVRAKPPSVGGDGVRVIKGDDSWRSVDVVAVLPRPNRWYRLVVYVANAPSPTTSGVTIPPYRPCVSLYVRAGGPQPVPLSLPAASPSHPVSVLSPAAGVVPVGQHRVRLVTWLPPDCRLFMIVGGALGLDSVKELMNTRRDPELFETNVAFAARDTSSKCFAAVRTPTGAFIPVACWRVVSPPALGGERLHNDPASGAVKELPATLVDASYPPVGLAPDSRGSFGDDADAGAGPAGDGAGAGAGAGSGTGDGAGDGDDAAASLWDVI